MVENSLPCSKRPQGLFRYLLQLISCAQLNQNEALFGPQVTLPGWHSSPDAGSTMPAQMPTSTAHCWRVMMRTWRPLWTQMCWGSCCAARRYACMSVRWRGMQCAYRSVCTTHREQVTADTSPCGIVDSTGQGVETGPGRWCCTLLCSEPALQQF